MLKLDVQFGVSLILLAGFFLFNAATSVALWINVSVIALAFLWAILGWQAVRLARTRVRACAYRRVALSRARAQIIRENKVLLVFYFLFMVAEPAYIVYKVLQFYTCPVNLDGSCSRCGECFDCVYIPCILFTVSGALAIVLRVVLLVFTVYCVRNFNKGMRRGTPRMRMRWSRGIAAHRVLRVRAVFKTEPGAAAAKPGAEQAASTPASPVGRV